MDKSSSREKLFSEVVKKVLLYSSERSTNHSKLAKYLSLIRQQQLNLTGLIEKKLQKCGIVQALILLFNRQLGANNNESSTTISAEGSRKSTTVQVLTTGLSILGNAFAVDSESRRQAEKLAFVSTLKYFLQSTSKFSSNADILSRVLKCLANLAQHDQIRGSILRDGIGITIVIRLEEIYTRLTNTLGAEDKIDEIIIEKDEESIICQAARAIRIFSSNFEFQQHLIRFGAIVALGRFLMFSHNRILFSDILKALAVLTTSMKKIPRDVLEALTDAEPQKSVPQRIITILKSHPSTKCLAEPATICLTQLACNTSLAKSLVSSNVFEVTLQAIKQTEDVDQLEKLLRLLVVLTQESPSSMDCNLSHRLRLSCCSQIGETVKILQMTKLKHYHTWILKLYENLYEDKLKDLVARGIISFLDEYLREKLGDYSFDSLGKKLSAQDDDHCYVHTDSKCPFSPKYRCTSPTYQQMQDIEKRNSKSMEAPKPVQSAFEINNALSSPYSSPPQSPTCDDGDRYAFVGTYSPSESLTTSLTTSPTYSKQFHYSPESSSGSDDEGIGSSSTISPNQSVFSGSPSKDDGNLDSVCTEYSEDECEDNGEVETMDVENIESTKIDDRSDEFEPPKKRAKFDATTITGDDAHGAKRDEILMNIDDDDEMKTNVETLVPQKTDNISLEQIRQRYTKIASILGILNRLSHFTSVPSDLTKFLPFLFEIIWSTRMSVEKAEDNKLLENVEELLPLGSLNLCFQRAFKIVTRICSDINTFPNLVENGVIPLVYRILLYNFREVRESDENEIIIHSRNQYHRSQPCHPRHRTTVKEFINDYSIKLMKTLVGMSGSQNESIGWRHGYFLRTCCIPGQMQSAGTRYVNAILSIPLLYRSPRELRPFEEKTGNWEKIFELLTNVDESVPFTTFQNCILALMCMGQTKGLTWSDAETATKKPLLYPPTTVPVTIPPPVPSSSNTRVDDAMQANKTVVFELDDGSTMTLQKAQLVNASPVFAAMFDGHFREAGQQRVNLRQVSRSALNALAMQIYQQSRAENNSKPNDDSTNKEATSLINEDNNHRSSSVISSDVVNQTFDYELSTIFELLSLCDQFLLDNLYERTLNTLIGFYICPFSAPTIYVESLTFGGLHKSDIQLSSAKNLNLSRLALKYLLVGENISLSMRSGAFWKLFETTLPSVVVQGLREILNVKTPH